GGARRAARTRARRARGWRRRAPPAGRRARAGGARRPGAGPRGRAWPQLARPRGRDASPRTSLPRVAAPALPPRVGRLATTAMPPPGRPGTGEGAPGLPGGDTAGSPAFAPCSDQSGKHLLLRLGVGVLVLLLVPLPGLGVPDLGTGERADHHA